MYSMHVPQQTIHCQKSEMSFNCGIAKRSPIKITMVLILYITLFLAKKLHPKTASAPITNGDFKALNTY